MILMCLYCDVCAVLFRGMCAFVSVLTLCFALMWLCAARCELLVQLLQFFGHGDDDSVDTLQ